MVRYTAQTGAGFSAVHRVSPTQQVRDQLRAAIERGDYPPGAPLPSERELCAGFGVSRVSVREALAGLEATGLIAVRHGRGAFVAESLGDRGADAFADYLALHRADLVELAAVHGALDALAAEQAARGATRSALTAVHRAGRAFARATHGAEAALADAAFHRAVAAAGATVLPGLLGALDPLLTEATAALFAAPERRARAVTDHDAILAALRAKDPAAARRAAGRHTRRTVGWLQG